MSRIALKINGLSCGLKGSQIFTDVSFRLGEGKIGCLLGPSGCGKTTLLRCIAGLEEPSQGTVEIDEMLVCGPGTFIPPEDRNVGVVFQDYALFPHLTVSENVAFGLRNLDKLRRETRVKDLLGSVDLIAERDRYPHELSGGQQQRVALARALAPQPRLLLLDEPFSNLDPSLRIRMKIELKRLLNYFGVTSIIVTHNQDEAFDIADEIGVLSDQRLMQWGTAYNLYHKPESRVVADFLGVGSFIPCHINSRGCVESELGELVCDESLKGYAGLDNLLLLLRPDDVVHDDSSAILARVKNVAFRGMFRIYELILDSGHLIYCFTSSHHEEHRIHSKIGIRMDVKHAVIITE